MSAIEPLCQLFGIQSITLSKEEKILLEAELFLRLCEELREIFREQYKDYFHLMKLTKDKENNMLESKFISFFIQDILATKEYNLEGIALYADTHEDVLHEAYVGLNLYPSAILLRKIIELHRTVRRELYQSIARKIALEYSSVA